MASSTETLLTIAPHLSTETTDRLEDALALAAKQMNAQVWDGLYELGAAYLAAHMLTLWNRSTKFKKAPGAGPVNAMSAGDESVSYGAVVAVTGSDAVLATTPYGVEHLRLRNMLCVTPLIA